MFRKSDIFDKYNIDLIRSDRRTVSLEVKPDLRIVVRVPRRMPLYEIAGFIRDREAWIEKAFEKIRLSNEKNSHLVPFSEEEIKKLTQLAKKTIPVKVEYYARLMGLDYGRITIRSQKSRWGSCSSKKNLNFNCLLMLTPVEVQDYVVVHELCHLKEMNHSVRFWSEVEAVLPDYRVRRKWLKDNGSALISKLP